MSSQYNAEHYATLVAYPAPFNKYPEPFLCLIGISRNYTLDEDTYPQFLRDNNEEIDLVSFIQTADPTNIRVGKRQRAEGEPKLLDTTIGHVVTLLPIARARASSELEASVDKLFNEGASGNHAERSSCATKASKKKENGCSNAGEPSHPPKKLREDHGTSTGPSVAGKSKSALQRLLAGAVTDGDQTDFMAGANLRTITAPPRPSISLMTMTTTITSTVDPTTTAKEKFFESSIFCGGSSSGAEHTVCGFSGLTSSDFIVGGSLESVRTPMECHQWFLLR
ncbi:hypothetical protein Tco_0982148 [Tanacetum coccineum]